MKTVRMNHQISGVAFTAEGPVELPPAGYEVEVSDELADELVRQGAAVHVVNPLPEKPAEPVAKPEADKKD